MAFSQMIPASCVTKVWSPSTTFCSFAVIAVRCGIAGLLSSNCLVLLPSMMAMPLLGDCGSGR